jgi:UDP-N-acetylglucosamine--N-acetylmuramyl-(pentapeptide) pyrophosphoryl-undecaprenol N-acetylglucosamine transferase
MNTPMRTALVMAGGTGGHIFPGLAVAEALRDRGWRVHWLGSPGSAGHPSMESQLVPPRGFAFESIKFSGVRGKGLTTLAFLPLRLLKAFWQSVGVIQRVKPDVVVGFGGYIAFPAGMMSVLMGKPLVLHEQNSVAGMVNKVLAMVADRVFTAFPNVLKNAEWVGNPLRPAFTAQPDPATRFVGRTGPLRLLVVGGSLGARALNTLVPQALALMPAPQRPLVTHQSGTKQIDALRANYLAAGVDATLTPFIEDTASAFADADLIICRAGASTVTEIAAVGAAALFVPFPAAVDDHQTTNARFLVDQGAGWLLQQRDLSPSSLASLLQKTERPALVNAAVQAKKMQKTEATAHVVAACEELTT